MTVPFALPPVDSRLEDYMRLCERQSEIIRGQDADIAQLRVDLSAAVTRQQQMIASVRRALSECRGEVPVGGKRRPVR